MGNCDYSVLRGVKYHCNYLKWSLLLFFCPYICPYYLHYCLFYSCVMSDRGRCPVSSPSPSHACKRPGTMSFLSVIAMHPAQSLVLLVTVFSKCEKTPAWKWSQQRGKQSWEMGKRSRVLLTLFKLSDLVMPEANTPPWTCHLRANKFPLLPKLIWVPFLPFAIIRRLSNTPSCLYFTKLQENQKEVFISKKVINSGIKVFTWLPFPAWINSGMQR